jgi:hypothetical protein
MSDFTVVAFSGLPGYTHMGARLIGPTLVTILGTLEKRGGELVMMMDPQTTTTLNVREHETLNRVFGEGLTVGALGLYAELLAVDMVPKGAA